MHSPTGPIHGDLCCVQAPRNTGGEAEARARWGERGPSISRQGYRRGERAQGWPVCSLSFTKGICFSHTCFNCVCWAQRWDGHHGYLTNIWRVDTYTPFPMRFIPNKNCPTVLLTHFHEHERCAVELGKKGDDACFPTLGTFLRDCAASSVALLWPAISVVGSGWAMLRQYNSVKSVFNEACKFEQWGSCVSSQIRNYNKTQSQSLPLGYENNITKLYFKNLWKDRLCTNIHFSPNTFQIL